MDTSVQKLQDSSPSANGEESLDALQWRVEALSKDRAVNAPMVVLLRERGFESQAERLEKCGEVVGRYVCKDCGHTGETQVNRYFCNQPLLCVICARKERYESVRETLDQVEKILERGRYGYSLKMITLTKKTDGRYAEAVDVVLKARGQIWKNLLGGRAIKDAGMKAIIEFGSKKGNVHTHCLYYGPYIAQKDISEAWERYTGDSSVVDIRRRKEAVEKIVKESIKYITKFGDASPQRRLEYWLAIRRKKRRMSYGLFRKDVLSKRLGYKYESPVREPLFDPDFTPCPNCGGLHWKYHRGVEPERGPPKLKVVKDSEKDWDEWYRKASEKAEAALGF